MKIFTLSVIYLIFFSIKIQLSQNTTSAGLFKDLPEGLKINLYTDVYYASDNDEGNYLREFSFIAPYRDNFKLNFVSLAARYSSVNFRSNAVFHFGDVPNLNWPEDNRYIQEANIGFSPLKKFWVDAGYFITHIGGEGLLPKYNHLTILSLCTSYEPWFQSGVRLSYEFSNKFTAQLHLVNGYNVLTDAHKHKSIGLQLDYNPNSFMEIIENNLMGDESPYPDNIPRFRYYNNLVIKFNPFKKVNLILCSDYSLQTKSNLDDPSQSANAFSGFASIKYYFANKFSLAVRGEFYNELN